MHIELTPVQARVIGCLIEKEITTPEQYPLSLNALTNACNQKSNREPVLELDDRTVQDTVDGLIKVYLVSEQTGYGSRVAKYKHRFCNSDYGKLHFTPQELAVVCELLLRGPQTPGELRSHASRMATLRDVHEVEALLEGLAAREDGPFVVRLARQPGKREARYAHLFSGAVTGDVEPAAHATAAGDSGARLEERVAQLEAEVATLRERLAVLESPPESQLP
ncbi:MAG TPA: DUF480 domain-containing protein [Rhodocyclaceae bacterium]